MTLKLPPLREMRKTLIAVIALGCALAGMLITVPVGFQHAAVMLGGSAIGVLVVFTTKNHTEDDYSKAVMALITSGATVAGYFVTVPVSTVGTISLIAGALISYLGVKHIPNDNPGYAVPVPPAANPAAPRKPA